MMEERRPNFAIFVVWSTNYVSVESLNFSVKVRGAPLGDWASGGYVDGVLYV